MKDEKDDSFIEIFMDFKEKIFLHKNLRENSQNFKKNSNVSFL